MKTHHITWSFAVLASCTVTAIAQPATTVQLPNFAFSTVNTTVTAPDGGTVILGGVNRLSEGRNERGVPILGKVPGLNRLFKNNAIGRDVSARNFTVTPRIIILEEEEMRQTGRGPDGSFSHSARPAFAGVDPVVASRADYLSQHISSHAAGARMTEQGYSRQYAADRYSSHITSQIASQNAGNAIPHASERTEQDVYRSTLPTPEEIRQRNELAAAQRDAEAVKFYDKARTAAEEGKAGVARIYFKMASSRAKGEFKDEILAQLDALDN